MTPALGVCYYPEHWPEAQWPEDAARMAALGLTWVRIGEFAWSRIEPRPGALEFDWLDRAIGVLSDAGLNIVLGTPTATPPRWMLDRHPDMLALDVNRAPRGFGSRRHYCFSHAGYRDEAARIAGILGRRYGRDPRIGAWQIDNEYGCHDTTLSYSAAALAGFRAWLHQRYGDIATLNRDWGNVFWSMDYDDFDQIDLPGQSVTEPNPAHVMAFRRYSSDQVVAFNKVQCDLLRTLTDAPLIHNYMGRVLDFDHFDVGRDLDIASWDSYPIGFLSDRLEADDDHKAAFLQQGDPDMQAFHHDLYRAVGRGRWWVMEQQPGPVNWAPYNPAPLPGMVRLWSLEAVAHGAEVVSYFRWRQLPSGQEQMHAGLLLPDSTEAPGHGEAARVAADLARLPALSGGRAEAAILFDYPSFFAWDTLPQGRDFDYFRLVFSAYRALRLGGLSVDILPVSARDLDGYRVILAPGLAMPDADLAAALAASPAVAVLGPRSFAATPDLGLAQGDLPGFGACGLNVSHSESLPPLHARPVAGGGAVRHWFEHLRTGARCLLQLETGDPVLVAHGDLWYLSGWPDAALWARVVALAADRSGLSLTPLAGGLRLRRAGDVEFAFNYGATAARHRGVTIEPCGVAAWSGPERLL